MANYISTIDFCSKPDLTARERIILKDVSDAISIDAATSGDVDALIIHVDHYAVIKVHNEASEDKDYIKYVIVDKGGMKYVTGSDSFFRSFTSIASEMAEYAPDEEYSIKVFRKESNNYKGKTFITCSLV